MFVEVKYFVHLNLSVALFLASGSEIVFAVVAEAHQSVVSNPPRASITHLVNHAGRMYSCDSFLSVLVALCLLLDDV